MPSRRDTVGTVAAGVVVALAGCSQLQTSTDATTADETSTDATTVDDTNRTAERSSFTLELVGPEERQTLFTEADTADVGEVRQQGETWMVPVRLTPSATTALSETFETAGVADDPEAFEAVVRVDGETVDRFGFAPSLASAVASGDYDGSFVVTFPEEDAADRARRALAGD